MTETYQGDWFEDTQRRHETEEEIIDRLIREVVKVKPVELPFEVPGKP